MTDETSAPAGGDAIAVITPAADTPATLTASDAARILNSMRNKPKEAPVEQAQAAAPVEQNELSGEDNAGPEEVPSETQEDDPAEVPPIDPPRSWTKEAKDRWNTIPREAQEEFARIEQGREREFLRSQQEAAEQRKAFQAEREKAEKVRQEYEAKLPGIMQLLQSKGEFADIRTLDDVKKLQMEDPFRFQTWQLHQMELQAVNAELQQAESRKVQDTQQKAIERKSREHNLLIEKHPELADTEKLTAAQTAVVGFLRDKGYSDAELNELASSPLLDDHRLQLALLDGARYRELQKAPAKALPKSVPPVTRPGTSRPQGQALSEQAQALEKQLTSSGSLKAAQELRALQLRTRRA